MKMCQWVNKDVTFTSKFTEDRFVVFSWPNQYLPAWLEHVHVFVILLQVVYFTRLHTELYNTCNTGLPCSRLSSNSCQTVIWSHGRNFSFQIFSLSRFFGHYWCYYWRHGHMHLVSKSPSNEMGNQDKLELTGRQKWPSQVACVLENVKCWGVWNTTCGHKAKDITLFNRLEERGVEKAKDITH